jgi:hypothetical protein
VSSQPYAPAALPPSIKPPVPIERYYVGTMLFIDFKPTAMKISLGNFKRTVRTSDAFSPIPSLRWRLRALLNEPQRIECGNCVALIGY